MLVSRDGTPNRRGLLSLRSCYGYVAAEANGKIRANREQIGAWEVFQVPPGVGNPCYHAAATTKDRNYHYHQHIYLFVLL